MICVGEGMLDDAYGRPEDFGIQIPLCATEGHEIIIVASLLELS